MRFHCLGIPHTISNNDYIACAFTQKVVKFCEMMKARGHYIIHYGHDRSEVVADEIVGTTNDAVLKEAYGDYDWHSNVFKFAMDDPAYKMFYARTNEEIAKRKQYGDFLLCFWGHGHKPIADFHPDMIVVEPGIGYPGGTFAPYKVYESQYMLGAFHGTEAVGTPDKFSWYDAVIPNYFDTRQFTFNADKEDYFLFIGRIGHHKGLHIAIEVTQAIGAKLKVAGQGDIKAMGYDKIPDHVEFVGYAGVEERRKLMANAKGQFVATMYGEPFGGVQIEGMLSGTPIISTDWGCFQELNLHGITGFRCRTFEQFVWAAKNIGTISPIKCREWAENFSMEKVAAMYEEYFTSISNIYGKAGWYEPNNERTNLDWLTRKFPVP